jgi:hypothetical protein
VPIGLRMKLNWTLSVTIFSLKMYALT